MRTSSRVLTLGVLIFRPQGDHNLLLHLYDANHDFIGLGLGSHPSRLRRLPIFYRGAEWLYIRLVYLPFDQWVRRVPALRGWHDPVRLVDPWLFLWHVSHLGGRVAHDIQEQARAKYHEHVGLVRGTVSRQRNILVHICGDASHPCHQHFTRSMAIGRYLVWSFFLRHRPGDFIRFQRHHLQ